MSNDIISVPRELAEGLAKALKLFTGHDSYPNLRRHYGNAWWEPIDKMHEGLRTALTQRSSPPARNCPICPPPGATHTISGQFYRKADGAWLMFGHKHDWVPSDAPAGWNDENLVPLFPIAHAPAVLPERADAMMGSHDHQSSWNACLGEFKRLNPGVTEAAPPRKS